MTTISSPAAFIQQAKANGKPLEQQVRVHKFEPGKKMLPYSRRDYYKIWVTVGEGKIHYATRTIEISQPALIFSNPRVPYSFESENVNGGCMCIFTEDFLKVSGRYDPLHDSPLFRAGSNPVFFLDEPQFLFISSIYDKMKEELNTTYMHRFDVVRHYLSVLIHEGMKMEPASNAVKYHNASERIANLFLELLERQFPIDSPQQALKLRKATDYAENLSVHVNHLNYAVREVTGKSTSNHITERIIMEAKALLLHTDFTVADIAYCLGFDYPNYFNNFFKKNTGMTPLSVRR
jgi:AraC family transcriptional regulator, transcriptional activator of pobA